jgi:hypothetical protein
MSSPQAFAQIGKAIRASSSEPKVGIQFIQADGFHHSYRAQIVTSQLMVKFPEFSKITAPRYTHQPWISVVFPVVFLGFRSSEPLSALALGEALRSRNPGCPGRLWWGCIATALSGSPSRAGMIGATS